MGEVIETQVCLFVKSLKNWFNDSSLDSFGRTKSPKQLYMDSIKAEGDGLLEDFYEALWRRVPRDSGIRGIVLPHTVVFKHQQARSWYYTTSSGVLLKKTKGQFSLERVEAAFLKHKSRSQIVASFTYVTGNGREIEYFQAEELHQFLCFRINRPDGILQQFLDPKGLRNSAIQMIWSPNVCLFEYRENLKNIFDLRYGVYDRAVTFEGDPACSRTVPLKGGDLQSHLRGLAQTMISHIAAVTQGSVIVKRMILLFKVDSQERLCFLRALSLRSSSDRPLDINGPTHLPEIIQSTKKKPTAKCGVLCNSCRELAEVQKLYALPYKFIVGAQRRRGIPKLIAEEYPELSLEEYIDAASDEVFLAKSCLVCVHCYIHYSAGFERRVLGSTAFKTANVSQAGSLPQTPSTRRKRVSVSPQTKPVKLLPKKGRACRSSRGRVGSLLRTQTLRTRKRV